MAKIVLKKQKIHLLWYRTQADIGKSSSMKNTYKVVLTTRVNPPTFIV